jgi:hypothetical protein
MSSSEGCAEDPLGKDVGVDSHKNHYVETSLTGTKNRKEASVAGVE